jgi:hypothetical protein
MREAGQAQISGRALREPHIPEPGFHRDLGTWL